MFVINSIRHYPDIICGAAIPIVGSVVGVAQGISSMNAQKQQAAAQQSALDTQAKISGYQTEMRLVDLQRQKAYSGYLSMIQQAGRDQQRMSDNMMLQTAQIQDGADRAMAEAQNQSTMLLGNASNEAQMQQASMANQSVYDLNSMAANSGYQIESGNIQNQGAVSSANSASGFQQQQLGSQADYSKNSASLDQSFLQSTGQNQIGNASNQYDLASGLNNSLVSNEVGRIGAQTQNLGQIEQGAGQQMQYNTEAFNVQSQAADAATSVYSQMGQQYAALQRANDEAKRAKDGIMAQMAAQGTGGASRSDMALQSGLTQAQLTQYQQTKTQSDSATGYSQRMTEIANQRGTILQQQGKNAMKAGINKANANSAVIDAQAGLTTRQSLDQYKQKSSMAQGQTNANQQAINSGYGINRNSLEQTNNIGNAYRNTQQNLEQQMISSGVDLSQLSARDQYILGQISNQGQLQYSNQNNQNQYNLNKLALSSGYDTANLTAQQQQALNQVGYDTYQSSKDIQYGLDTAVAGLNQSFYDTSLSSSAANVKIQGASEMSQINSAKASIKAPGFLDYASMLGSGYNAISGAIPNKAQSPQSSPVSYNTGASNGSAYTGANSYGFLSGYKIGG